MTTIDTDSTTIEGLLLVLHYLGPIEFVACAGIHRIIRNECIRFANCISKWSCDNKSNERLVAQYFEWRPRKDNVYECIRWSAIAYRILQWDILSIYAAFEIGHMGLAKTCANHCDFCTNPDRFTMDEVKPYWRGDLLVMLAPHLMEMCCGYKQRQSMQDTISRILRGIDIRWRPTKRSCMRVYDQIMFHCPPEPGYFQDTSLSCTYNNDFLIYGPLPDKDSAKLSACGAGDYLNGHHVLTVFHWNEQERVGELEYCSMWLTEIEYHDYADLDDYHPEAYYEDLDTSESDEDTVEDQKDENTNDYVEDPYKEYDTMVDGYDEYDPLVDDSNNDSNDDSNDDSNGEDEKK